MSQGQRRTPGAESGRRLLAALLAFTPQAPTPTVAQLAEAVGVPTSTAYRYLALLRETGLVESAGEGTYRLTDRATALAEAAAAGRAPLVDAARPHLLALRAAIDETVLIARRGGTYAYCIAREESTHPVRLQFAVGQAMPLHSGSVARVLLASMPPSERDAYVRQYVATGAATNAALLADQALDQVADQGWTESYEEVDPGVWGCASAIAVDGVVVAAIGTAGPIDRLDPKRRRQAIAAVRTAADAIASALTA